MPKFIEIHPVVLNDAFLNAFSKAQEPANVADGTVSPALQKVQSMTKLEVKSLITNYFDYSDDAGE